ncbi:MAG: cyclic nucleotide-binding domain-containing protein [bacterium]
MTKIKPLRDNVLFRDFSDKEIAVLSKYMEEKSIAAPTPLFLENMPGESMFIIVSGAINIAKMRGEGETETLMTLGAGDFFGELALVENGPRAVSALTAQDSQLLVMKRSAFEKMMEESPQIAVKVVMGMYKTVTSRIKSCSPRIQEMLMGKEPS